MTLSLSLSDLLTRRLSLQWYEAIAIVRGVAEPLLDREGAGMPVPEPHQIELRADGSVTLAGGLPTSQPVRRLAQLLQAMLTDAEVPVQLRLIVSQATAPIPLYSTLNEFDQAIAYFERPDRTGLLLALFARAEAAGPGPKDDAALTLDSIAPLPEAKAMGASARHHRKHSPRLLAAVAALVAVLALSGAAVSWVKKAGKTVKGREVARAAEVAADALGKAVLSGVSAVSDSVGLGRLVAANAADNPPSPPPAAPSTSERKARSVAISGVEAGIEPANASVANASPRRVVGYEVPDQGPSLTEARSQPQPTPEPAVDRPGESVIYATGADHVLPPVGVRPQLPRQLPSTVKLAELSRIELIIARDGSVESAKLLGDRRDVQGGMFLSAAKSWQFQPATKDGVAVRYRTTILVSFE